jgi:CHASE3 domain sensor protein
MALPLMQKMLPLLEGNVATVVSNMMAPSPQGHAPDLAPLANALTKMHEEIADLRSGTTEQGALLKRVGDQVDLVKDAADRLALEQQEIVDDLHSLRKKVTAFAWLGLVLLIASIVLNVVLLLRVERLLP